MTRVFYMHYLKELACLLIALAALSQTVVQDPNARKPRAVPQLKWDQYVAIADLISDLPAWTTSADDLRKDEWHSLATTARALRPLSEQDMERILIVYMSRYAADLPPEMDDPDPRTKPLLLLATMFDLQHPYDASHDDLYRDRDITGVQVCGGFFWSVGRHLERIEEFALPVSWDDKGPRLTAKRVTGVSGGTGESHYPYQPHIEYRHFRSYYPVRLKFDPISVEDDVTWQKLVTDRTKHRHR